MANSSEVKENDLPGNPLRFVAGLQRLPNGNTLICNWGGHGFIGQQPQICEITRDKQVVGEIYDFTPVRHHQRHLPAGQCRRRVAIRTAALRVTVGR